MVAIRGMGRRPTANAKLAVALVESHEKRTNDAAFRVDLAMDRTRDQATSKRHVPRRPTK
jgi:hypothetical protein